MTSGLEKVFTTQTERGGEGSGGDKAGRSRAVFGKNWRDDGTRYRRNSTDGDPQEMEVVIRR